MSSFSISLRYRHWPVLDNVQDGNEDYKSASISRDLGVIFDQ